MLNMQYVLMTQQLKLLNEHSQLWYHNDPREWLERAPGGPKERLAQKVPAGNLSEQ